MDSSVSQKDEIWFLRVCHHISNAVYFRMSSDTFKRILELIHTLIKKQNAIFRRSISPEERLMVTLR